MIRWILVFIILVHWWKAWSFPEVIFEKEIEVSARQKITFADIVQVKNGTVEILNFLAAQEITADVAKLKVTQIKKMFRESLQEQSFKDQVRVTFPNEINWRLVPKFSEVEFKRKLMNHLGALCNNCEINALIKNSVYNQVGPNWRTDWNELKLSPSLLISVKQESGALDKWISVQVKILKEVWMTKKSISAQDKIDSDLLIKKKMDITFLKESAAQLSDVKLFPYASKMIPADRILLISDLRKEWAVIRGQMIKVMLSQSSLEVSTLMMAEENGALGDTVKIRNIDNKKISTVELVDKGVGVLR